MKRILEQIGPNNFHAGDLPAERLWPLGMRRIHEMKAEKEADVARPESPVDCL
jgi:hypothetical protein